MQEFCDWKAIPGHSEEKYRLYLCSPEWGAKRSAIRRRSGGTCERCKRNPAVECHHMTYSRRYREPLTDLMDLCRGCHQFSHTGVGEDPAAESGVTVSSVATGTVSCPNCGTPHDNVHMMGVRVIQHDLCTAVSGDGVKQTNVEPAARDGSDVALQFVCECGQRFEWQLMAHDGRVLFFVETRAFPILDTELWRR